MVESSSIIQEPTPGDAIVMSADVLRLLAPVLKHTTKEHVELLKRSSVRVRGVFERMLNDQPPVVNYGGTFRSRRVFNKTGLEFENNLCFEVEAVALGAYPDTFDVTIVIPGMLENLWSYRLSERINWLGDGCKGFISLEDALAVKSAAQARQLRDKVQSTLIAERASILFFKSDQSDKGGDIYGVCLELDNSACRWVDYFRADRLKPLLKSV